MKDQDKTKGQLINKLEEMRQRVMELEASEAKWKQAEETPRESEESYRTLVEDALIGIMNLDITGRITYINQTILKSTGYSSEELVGRNVFRLGLVSRETARILRKRMKEKLMGEPPGIMQIQFSCKDGERIWLQIKGRALWKYGVPVGIQIIGEDITEHKQMELELQESERRFRSFVEQSPSPTVVLDADSKILHLDQRFELSGIYQRYDH